MGHAIDYITVDKRSEIMSAAQDFALYNTDRYENPSGSYHGNMKIHDNIVRSSYEDAVSVLEAFEGRYEDHALRYEDKSALKPTKTMLNLKEKMEKNRKDKAEYAEKHSLKERKSEFIGCKKCGSKISAKYLRGNRCPVCGEDLRAEYIIERLNKYDKDYRDMQKKYSEMEKNQKGKCPVRWLVKVEVHC